MLDHYFLDRHQDRPSEFAKYSKSAVEEFLHANERSVSAGKVKAASEKIVSYGVSTSPGASGAPVLSTPGYFYAIHEGTVWEDENLSDANLKFARGASNHGILISNPEFQ